MQDYNTKQLAQFRKDFIYCKQYISSYGSNYNLATLLFTKNVRENTIILYAFFRFIDEVVDSPSAGTSNEEIINSLNKIKKEWQDIINKDISLDNVNPVLRATFFVFESNKIPFEYSISFIDAMIMDTKIKRYETYAELEKYMYGSASVVGYIMTYLVGYSSHEAFTFAKYYGEAMQLTNFLRDIEEDYVLRDRIYLPLDLMRKYSVTEEMIKEKNPTQEFKNLIKELDLKSQELYTNGRQGFKFLNSKNLLPIIVAGDIYEYNLNILRRRNYNPFGRRIRVPFLRKILIIIKNYLLKWTKN